MTVQFNGYFYSKEKKRLGRAAKIFLQYFKINKDVNFHFTSLNSEEISKFSDQTNVNMKTNLFNSYDNFLNKKYKIKINQKTLERVKNYFN